MLSGTHDSERGNSSQSLGALYEGCACVGHINSDGSTMEPFDLQFDLHLVLQPTMLLAKVNDVIYFDQSQLLLAKTNEDRISSRKALLIVCVGERADWNQFTSAVLSA